MATMLCPICGNLIVLIKAGTRKKGTCSKCGYKI